MNGLIIYPLLANDIAEQIAPLIIFGLVLIGRAVKAYFDHSAEKDRAARARKLREEIGTHQPVRRPVQGHPAQRATPPRTPAPPRPVGPQGSYSDDAAAQLRRFLAELRGETAADTSPVQEPPPPPPVFRPVSQTTPHAPARAAPSTQSFPAGTTVTTRQMPGRTEIHTRTTVIPRTSPTAPPSAQPAVARSFTPPQTAVPAQAPAAVALERHVQEHTAQVQALAAAPTKVDIRPDSLTLQRLQPLLAGRQMRDAILLREIIGPPIALRRNDLAGML